ncbi:MAG TPA: preprotein translocase subunit YajC [Bacteroidota bacterium]|nr:preprotein translocase subunit YajC [Bacteroidota bacterium]
MTSNLILFGAIIAIFYFMIMRPQQKRQKERDAMLSALKKGDKVITAGGVHGTIAGLEEKTILVQIADNVKVKVERGSITSVEREAEPATK